MQLEEFEKQIRNVLKTIATLEAEVTSKKRGYKYCSYFPHTILGRNLFAIMGGNDYHPVGARFSVFMVNHLIWHRLLLSTTRYVVAGTFSLPTLFILYDLYWIAFSYGLSNTLAEKHAEHLQKVGDLKTNYQILRVLLEAVVKEKLNIDLDIGNENIPENIERILDKIQREEMLTRPIPLKKYEKDNDMTWYERWLNLQPSALTEWFYSKSDTSPKLN